MSFVVENQERICAELEKNQSDIDALANEAAASKEENTRRRKDIEDIKKTIQAADEESAVLEQKLKESRQRREEMNVSYKGYFSRREEISEQINRLDKEIYQLNLQREKNEQALEYQRNYMWEEYEATFHAALKLKDEIDDGIGCF